MQSTEHCAAESKASLWVAFLAFAVAALALFHDRAGAVGGLSLACGLYLVFVRLRQERDAADRRRGLAQELERARALLGRSAHRQALAVAHDVAERAQSASIQRAALELVAWCELQRGRPQAARDALSWLSETADPYCTAAVEDACGQSLWALHILERAARKRQLAREATLFRIDLYARLRGVEAACALTVEQLARLPRQDAERVLGFAQAAQATGSATRALAVALGVAPEICR